MFCVFAASQVVYGDKLGAVVCVCRAVCAFNGVTGVGGGWRTSSSPLCQ